MKTTLIALAVTFLFAATALPLAAQVNDTYVIPGVGNTPGAFGTRWMSQVSIFNPQLDHALRVSITYLPGGGGKGQEVLVTVPANNVAFWDNAVSELFGIGNGAGALLVATFPEDNPGVPDDMISRSILVTSNTFNNASSGTYGQTIPGTWTGLQADGITAVSHGIRNLSRFGWRTNFGALNISPTSVTLLISVYDPDGDTLIKDSRYTLPANGTAQWLLPVEVDHGSVEFHVEDPLNQAVVFPYTSTIDQYSGDPTYQSPTLLASTKVLYPKTAAAAALAAPGRKLTIDDARVVRGSVTRLGEVALPR